MMQMAKRPKDQNTPRRGSAPPSFRKPKLSSASTRFNLADGIESDGRLEAIFASGIIRVMQAIMRALAEAVRVPRDDRQVSLKLGGTQLGRSIKAILSGIEEKDFYAIVYHATLCGARLGTPKEMQKAMAAFSQRKRVLGEGPYALHGTKEEYEAHVALWDADRARGLTFQKIAETTPIRPVDENGQVRVDENGEPSRFSESAIRKAIRNKKKREEQNGQSPASG
jgi:hypothetical protein